MEQHPNEGQGQPRDMHCCFLPLLFVPLALLYGAYGGQEDTLLWVLLGIPPTLLMLAVVVFLRVTNRVVFYIQFTEGYRRITRAERDYGLYRDDTYTMTHRIIVDRDPAGSGLAPALADEGYERVGPSGGRATYERAYEVTARLLCKTCGASISRRFSVCPHCHTRSPFRVRF